MTSTMAQVATTCTTVNEQKTYAELPPGTKGYLQEKIEYALKAPDIVNIRLPDGSNTIALLKQLVMTEAIRVDEGLAEYRWQYKASALICGPTLSQTGGTRRSRFRVAPR